MSTDDGWIVATGTSVAHYRQHGHYVCHPTKKLRGVHMARAFIPALRCGTCLAVMEREVDAPTF